jgi:hypothetical protein
MRGLIKALSAGLIVVVMAVPTQVEASLAGKCFKRCNDNWFTCREKIKKTPNLSANQIKQAQDKCDQKSNACYGPCKALQAKGLKRYQKSNGRPSEFRIVVPYFVWGSADEVLQARDDQVAGRV